jgi:hypothetical protein
MNALARLKAGKPLTSELAARAREGRLHINPLTVAREAGRSRTLIGSDECKYPHIRELVLQASERTAHRHSGRDVMDQLKSAIKELQHQLSTARTIMAAQRIAIDALSRAAP